MTFCLSQRKQGIRNAGQVNRYSSLVVIKTETNSEVMDPLRI